MSALRNRAILIGTLGSISLLAIYFGIVTVTASFSHAIDTFREMQYLMSALIVGFGIQSGLFYFIHASLKAIQHASATASVATSGGVSATSMVLCCAHHLTEAIPFLGVSAATAFLADYQKLSVIFGVLANAVGVVFMVSVIQRAGLAQNELLNRYDMKRAVKAVGALAVIIFLAAIYIESKPG